jgi:carboxyl-terminal processing protease
MTRLIILCICVTVCIITSCSKETFNGTWKSIGYGQQLEVNGSVAIMYDRYQSGCNVSFEVPTRYLKQNIEVLKVTKDSLTIKQGITEFDFVKVDNGDKRCADRTNNKNPIVNFDALWDTFNENYSSFKIRQINWVELRDKYRSRIAEQSPDNELYLTLNNMLAELNDGHVSLDKPESLKSEGQEDDSLEFLRKKVLHEINSKYLISTNSYNRGTINYGLINKDVSYIQINDLENLADYQIDNNLKDKDYWTSYQNSAESSSNHRKDVINGMKKYLNSLFEDIKNTSHCIVDMRFNDGGLDEAGLEVISYFIDERTYVFNKQARFEGDLTREQKIFIKPAKKHYDGKIYILTSHQTASAAEIFVLSSLSLPNTVRIGSNTEGIFSDILSKKLPNGWDYGLSNEVYKSIAGMNFEGVGITPDYQFNYETNTKDFYRQMLQELRSTDNAIETVLKLTKE